MKYSSKVPNKLCLKVQSVRMLNNLNIFRYSLKELFVILKKNKKLLSIPQFMRNISATVVKMSGAT